MALRRTRIRLALLGCLCLISLSEIQAQAIRPGIFLFPLRDSVGTGAIRQTTFNFDSANALTRAYIKRLADSVASLKTTNDYTIVRFYGSLGTNASDSVNLTIGVNGVYEAWQPNFDMYAFNFSMVATTPSTLVSTFRTDRPDYPMKAYDSLYIFRMSRNVTMTDTCALSIFKVVAGTGPDVNDKTAGTFYDRVPFQGFKLSNAANRFFTVDVAFRRKP